MPAYQCQNCETVFQSKTALQEHHEDCTATSGSGNTVFEDMISYISGISLNVDRHRVRNMFTLRNAGIMFGVLMMATLFLGTASFMTSTAPDAGSPTGAATATSNPALGHSVRSANDLPRLSGSEQPDQISTEPLTTEQQLWAVTQGGQSNQPGAVIYYNCENGCPDLVEDLTGFAQNYGGWVYVAPNENIGSRIAVTGLQFIQRHETFDSQQFHNEVCDGYYHQQLQLPGPIACAGGSNGTDGGGTGQDTQSGMNDGTGQGLAPGETGGSE